MEALVARKFDVPGIGDYDTPNERAEERVAEKLKRATERIELPRRVSIGLASIGGTVGYLPVPCIRRCAGESREREIDIAEFEHKLCESAGKVSIRGGR